MLAAVQCSAILTATAGRRHTADSCALQLAALLPCLGGAFVVPQGQLLLLLTAAPCCPSAACKLLDMAKHGESSFSVERRDWWAHMHAEV